MAYSKTTESDLSNICFSSETGTTLSEKLTDCYRQFTENKQNSFQKSSIVKQTIFISTTNNSEYIRQKKELLACAEDYFDELPPTSIIAQSPENGSLAVELICIPGLQSYELIHKKNEEASWLVIQRDRMKMVIAVGAGDARESTDIFSQSDSAFRQLNGILREEGMDFSDIIRQWNYIEQITTTVNYDDSPSQHYQIFNDVRSKYYRQASFKNGFPAATGIGMDFGGIIIDMIAVKFEDEGSVVAIKKPGSA